MTDIFEEVEEQLRSDRYFQLARKAWPWALGALAAALVVALAVWGFDSWSSGEAAKASETYAAGLESMQKGETAAAFDQFGQVARSSSRGYKALALMQQAGLRLADNKADEAAKLFDQAAAASPTPLIGDLARLKSAFALMDTAPYAAIEERLKPLTDAKRPYFVAAREGLAMAKLRAGRLQEARSDFVVLTLLPGAPDEVRRRAQVAMIAIDSGAAAGLPAAVNAALKLPPLPTSAPTPPAQGPQSGADQ